MGITAVTNLTRGAIGVVPFVGPPTAGTTEIQTITFGGTPTGGTFTLSFKGYTTAPIAWSATNATLVANIDAALEALVSIGIGGVACAVGTMTAGIGTITVTFNGANLVNRNLASAMGNVSSLTGTAPTLAVSRSTPGVDATFRNAVEGAVITDTANGVLYVNTSSTLYAPT
jgi:hypothetical protein